jgi:hypothetical protein
MSPLITPAAFDDYLIHTEPKAGIRQDKFQWIYRFPNGYGASILDANEVYVIKFNDINGTDPYNWHRAPDKETGIETQHGIIRVDSDEQIGELLNKIKEVEA